ncbi:MAG: FAD-binding protein, partial [Erysipelotrichaceae bacterium]|nr:FAD-binding protein [Erysipelotrichaceae bacterium]
MINIVGSGLAGLSCAINLAKQNKRCNLISVQESQRAQSVLAEGGINAALNTMGEDDSVDQHYEDTMKGGAYLADPETVKGLTENAIEIVNWLKDLGVPFELNEKGIVQRNFGGQKKKRTAYVKSSTGKMLMSALIDEARKYEIKGLIKRYDHHKVYDLIIEDNTCKGLRML